MSTQFAVGPTRDVQPGDTPDLNDGLLSRPVATSTTITRGFATYIDASDGTVKVATTALEGAGSVPFVPIETIDNQSGDQLPISGVTAPQRVAMTIAIVGGPTTVHPGTYLKIQTTTGALIPWVDGNTEPKYARFLGIEAALLDRDPIDPFGETLTPGIVPDQSVTGTDITFVGWVQLIESTAV